MRSQLTRLLLIAVVFLAAPAARAAQQPFPAGPPQAALIAFQLAVYYPGAPSEEPLAALRAIAAREAPTLALTPTLPKTPTGLHLAARMENEVQTKYAPPDLQALSYFGRGLSAAQSRALQQSKQALILEFSHPRQYTMQGLRSAYSIAVQVARRTGGLLWDEETREVFTPEAWQQRRIASWHDGLPDAAKNITIHAYKSGELVRSITLGMAKFGQPDLIVAQSSVTSSSAMADVINLLAQALAEGATVGPNGRVDLDIAALRHAKVREREIASYLPKAQGRASLALVKGTWEEGDPRNRLAEIMFTLHKAPDELARQAAASMSLYGSRDSIKNISHNDELEAASALARKKLPALQAAFARGLGPREYILVKAPFARPKGGSEWMWVEVLSWKGKVIEGTLNNDPFDIPTLRSGQRVKVNEDEVFDYIRKLPNGTQEGNTTAAIILKMQGETRE